MIALLATADIQMFDGTRYAPNSDAPVKDSLSIGFSMHLCDGCAVGVPANRCRDRIRDGDATDIDCGGSCQPCGDTRRCSAPRDCRSNACDAGTCAISTCSDGVRDGYESDVDCGGPRAPCTAGRACAADADCTRNACDNGVAQTGVCR